MGASGIDNGTADGRHAVDEACAVGGKVGNLNLPAPKCTYGAVRAAIKALELQPWIKAPRATK